MSKQGFEMRQNTQYSQCRQAELRKCFEAHLNYTILIVNYI